jgi:outer membrane protein assembly factor BamE (lipoprotein component of BamABCDE complex)
MKPATFVLIAASAAILAGCAWREGVRPWWTLREQNFAQITPVKSTKADVEIMVGKPLLTMVFHNLGEEVWDYRFTDGVKPHIAHVYFDMQGRMKYYWSHPDECPFRPAGCY